MRQCQAIPLHEIEDISYDEIRYKRFENRCHKISVFCILCLCFLYVLFLFVTYCFLMTHCTLYAFEKNNKNKINQYINILKKSLELGAMYWLYAVFAVFGFIYLILRWFVLTVLTNVVVLSLALFTLDLYFLFTSHINKV